VQLPNCSVQLVRHHLPADALSPAAAIDEPSPETLAARTSLAQLLLRCQGVLTSPAVASLLDRLAPVSALYDEMHDLPVVQKRSKCREMLDHRDELMQVGGGSTSQQVHWRSGMYVGKQSASAC
jgi:hypothetical protein